MLSALGCFQALPFSTAGGSPCIRILFPGCDCVACGDVDGGIDIPSRMFAANASGHDFPATCKRAC